MSRAMKESVTKLTKEAENKNSILICKFPDNTTGQYFSVFSGPLYNFGRTLVRLKEGILKCPCTVGQRNCVHKGVVRWYLGEGEEEEDMVGLPNDDEACDTDQDKSIINKKEKITEDNILNLDDAEFTELIPDVSACDNCRNDVLITLLVTKSGKVVDNNFVKTGVYI